MFRLYGVCALSMLAALAAPAQEQQEKPAADAGLATLEQHAGDPQALSAAITELAAQAEAPAAPALLPYLTHDDAQVRHAAAMALRKLANPEVTPALVERMPQVNIAARRELARAVEAAGTEDNAALRAVGRMALDPQEDLDTRLALMGALQHHAPAWFATDTAAVLLKQPETPQVLRERAAASLAETATREDTPLLYELVRQEAEKSVLLRLAALLNSLSGSKQAIGPDSEFAASEPGAAREPFIAQWAKDRARTMHMEELRAKRAALEQRKAEAAAGKDGAGAAPGNQ